MTSFTFPAMGSTVEIVLTAASPSEAAVARELAVELAEVWEATCSRFRASSELARLNARAGEPVAVSSRLGGAVAAALAAARATDGRFDPTVLPALVALGYDRTFAAVADDPPRQPAATGGWPPGAWVGVACTPAPTPTVTLPAGVALDLGGIAKGLYVDELVAHLRHLPGGCVSAGGDLRVWGDAPSGTHWLVGVEDPDHLGHDIAQLELREAAVATSAPNRRVWRQGGRRVHHLIDPRTGRPTENDLRAVTVVAATTAQAEAWSTALFVDGCTPPLAARALAEVELVLAVRASSAVEAFGQVGGVGGNDVRAA